MCRFWFHKHEINCVETACCATSFYNFHQPLWAGTLALACTQCKNKLFYYYLLSGKNSMPYLFQLIISWCAQNGMQNVANHQSASAQIGFLLPKRIQIKSDMSLIYSQSGVGGRVGDCTDSVICRALVYIGVNSASETFSLHTALFQKHSCC